MSSTLKPLYEDEGLTHKEASLEKEVSNSTTCKHDLIMKGIHEVYCKKCYWGIYVSGISDYEKLRKFYGKD